MQLQLSIQYPTISPKISHQDNVLLIGSCFTEHMSTRLQEAKWQMLANPNGILFNPLSVASALDSYLEAKVYQLDELFYLNELWQNWDFHSQFSNVDANAALQSMNQSIQKAHDFLKKTDWLIITLGSAYQYYDVHQHEVRPVANCHRAPGQWFEKRLLSIEEIVETLSTTLQRIQFKNPSLKVLFTISPVRHIRDGVIENNRSKARLIEAVHTLVERLPGTFYFPAYELAIDVLRDYRFFDIDMVHPNYACTQYIWNQFAAVCMTPAAQDTMKQMKEIAIAYQHATRFPETEAHKKFLHTYFQKVQLLKASYPYIDMEAEMQYFGSGIK